MGKQLWEAKNGKKTQGDRVKFGDATAQDRFVYTRQDWAKIGHL